VFRKEGDGTQPYEKSVRQMGVDEMSITSSSLHEAGSKGDSASSTKHAVVST